MIPNPVPHSRHRLAVADPIAPNPFIMVNLQFTKIVKLHVLN